MYTHAQESQHVQRGWRATGGIQFSFSAKWVPRTELRPSSLAASAFSCSTISTIPHINYLSVVVIRHHDQSDFQRVDVGLCFRVGKSPSWHRGVAASSRHDCRSRTQRNHIFHHEHEAERELEVGWGYELWKPALVMRFIQCRHHLPEHLQQLETCSSPSGYGGHSFKPLHPEWPCFTSQLLKLSSIILPILASELLWRSHVALLFYVPWIPAPWFEHLLLWSSLPGLYGSSHQRAYVGQLTPQYNSGRRKQIALTSTTSNCPRCKHTDTYLTLVKTTDISPVFMK